MPDSDSTPGAVRRQEAGWALLLLAAMLGGLVGLGGFTFVHAAGLSYLSDDPAACANCHVMWAVFDGWNHSSHKAVAACNDCHTPHDPVGKYAIKALNGWNHSVAFTTGDYPRPITITPLNYSVALNNCFYCHADFVIAIGHQHQPEPTDCLRCHVAVGHKK
jgi:cytochrome c nitrite reductase small subunit